MSFKESNGFSIFSHGLLINLSCVSPSRWMTLYRHHGYMAMVLHDQSLIVQGPQCWSLYAHKHAFEVNTYICSKIMSRVTKFTILSLF